MQTWLVGTLCPSAHSGTRVQPMPTSFARLALPPTRCSRTAHSARCTGRAVNGPGAPRARQTSLRWSASGRLRPRLRRVGKISGGSAALRGKLRLCRHRPYPHTRRASGLRSITRTTRMGRRVRQARSSVWEAPLVGRLRAGRRLGGRYCNNIHPLESATQQSLPPPPVHFILSPPCHLSMYIDSAHPPYIIHASPHLHALLPLYACLTACPSFIQLRIEATGLAS
jgi:hypothetical protein